MQNELEQLKEQYKTLISQESRTKEEKQQIHTLSMRISELKKTTKKEVTVQQVKVDKKQKVESDTIEEKEYKFHREDDRQLQDVLKLIDSM